MDSTEWFPGHPVERKEEKSKREEKQEGKVREQREGEGKGRSQTYNGFISLFQGDPVLSVGADVYSVSLDIIFLLGFLGNGTLCSHSGNESQEAQVHLQWKRHMGSARYPIKHSCDLSSFSCRLCTGGFHPSEVAGPNVMSMAPIFPAIL